MLSMELERARERTREEEREGGTEKMDTEWS